MTKAVLGTLMGLAVAVLLVALIRGRTPAPASGGPPPPAQSVTGTLKSGYVGIGGEHTGWMLLRVRPDPDLEVDVGKVRDKATELDGKRVRATGHLVRKRYVERGDVEILVLESLDAATD